MSGNFKLPKVGEIYKVKGNNKYLVEVIRVANPITIHPIEPGKVRATWVKARRCKDGKVANFPLGEFWMFHSDQPIENQEVARILYGSSTGGTK